MITMSPTRNLVRHSVRLLSIAAALLLSAGFLHAQPRPAPARPAPSATLGDMSRAFESLAARVRPSVVQILTSGYAAAPGDSPDAWSSVARQRGTGSGVVIDADGSIVTNAHVVEGAQRIRVMLGQPRDIGQPATSLLKPAGRLIDARLVGIDFETDLAVVKVEGVTLAPLVFADSDDLRQGQLVLAFGSPFGLENSVTMGVVSSVARQLKPDDPMVYIQTDAPINPGNSGGPLVDADGRLAGINTAILSESGGSGGVGFAAPSNIVRAVVDQIRRRGRVRRGVIGVHAQTVTPTLASGLGLAREWGVVVADVQPDTPAESAGIRVGDLIVSVDGKPMENARQFDVNIYRRDVGDTVALELLRGTTPMKTTAAVIERGDDPMRFFDLVSPERNLVPRLGILAIEIDSKVGQRLQALRAEGGVLVVARAVTSLPTVTGLRPGDVIVGLNGVPVATLSALRVALDRLSRSAPCVLHVQRGPQLVFVALELE
jgi:serine protease Do